jgi:predicted DNA-binding mobile mystery protein A
MSRISSARSIGTDRVLARFLEWAATAPEGAGDFAVHTLIRLTRARLGMTQAQLARRCGLPQSHIAKIEKGKVDVQFETLRRIFRALFCRIVLAPRADKDMGEIIREQARKAAAARVHRVDGSMVMESQGLDEGALENLVRAETEKLLRKRPSAIWDIE